MTTKLYTTKAAAQKQADMLNLGSDRWTYSVRAYGNRWVIVKG